MSENLAETSSRYLTEWRVRDSSAPTFWRFEKYLITVSLNTVLGVLRQSILSKGVIKGRV